MKDLVDESEIHSCVSSWFFPVSSSDNMLGAPER